jgi:hypothetical protein
MCEAELAEGGRLRQAIWRQVDPEAYERQGLSPTNRAVIWIVALSSILAIFGDGADCRGNGTWALCPPGMGIRIPVSRGIFGPPVGGGRKSEI